MSGENDGSRQPMIDRDSRPSAAGPATQVANLTVADLSSVIAWQIEVLKPEFRKLEWFKPGGFKPEGFKPEGFKPEAFKPESLKPELSKPDPFADIANQVS
jgi:hypothetical protein